ncbi:MAG: hypothetical protein GMKNLPBB_02291 [Myxococcota bacterium]|nr:hypothetical protein [Myxococcota bacterium]
MHNQGDEMAMNPRLAGKSYGPHVMQVTAEHIASYALATESRHHPYYSAGGVAPPMFCITAIYPVMIAPVHDAELRCDYARLVHASQTLTFARLLRPGMEVRTVSRIRSIDVRPSGEMLHIDVTAAEADGSPVAYGETMFFIRAEGKAGGKGKAGTLANAEGVRLVKVHLGTDQAERYAKASGDMNPIHLDAAYAREQGLPGAILHGLCTMGVAHHAVIDGCLGARPAALKHIRMRFLAPVLPGDDLTVAMKMSRAGGETRVEHEVLNGAQEAVASGVAYGAGDAP